MVRDFYGECPACGVTLGEPTEAGNRPCRACGGLWVPESGIVEMIAELGDDDAAVTFVSKQDASTVRCCPECHRALGAGALGAIATERCPKSHGYWFDAFELEAALFRARRSAG